MALPANIVDLDPVDFCGKQVMSFSEAFWTATFQRPALNELLTVVTGVKAKQQVVILGLMGAIGRTMQTTNCAPDVSTAEIPSVEKFYDPAYIEDRFTECWKNLLGKFTVWGLKTGIQKPDLTGTDFANFLEERVLDALEEAIYRIVWFGETTAATYATTGHFTTGTDLRLVNAIDGVWAQIFAIVAGNPAQRVTIAKNSEATFALQKFDATDTTNQVVTGYLQEMVDGLDPRVDVSTLKFFVTRSVASQYRKERRAFNNIDLAYNRTESGWDLLEFDGIEIVVLNFEDQMIKTYQSSATASYLPHRIYLSSVDNLHLATEEESSMSSIKAFFDNVTAQYYIDILYTVDFLIIEDYKLMAAY